MRIALLLVASLLLPACGAVGCQDYANAVTILIVDAQGDPVVGATLTSTNLGSGEVDTRLSDSQGHATLSEGLGAGIIRSVATLGSRTSAKKDTRWSCDRCHCDLDEDLDPGSIVLP